MVNCGTKLICLVQAGLMFFTQTFNISVGEEKNPQILISMGSSAKQHQKAALITDLSLLEPLATQILPYLREEFLPSTLNTG